MSAERHLEFIEAQRDSRPPLAVSSLQVPSWGKVKSEWAHESLGWFEGHGLVGVGLVLYRRVPRSKLCLAYLPEGPSVPWERYDADELLKPLLTHCRSRSAFTVKIGPQVWARRWGSVSVKSGLADDAVHRLGDLPADETNPLAATLVDRLRALGWKQDPDTGAGFGDVQPRYVYQVPLRNAEGHPRTEGEILAGFNQLWRRNIKKADAAGVEVSIGTTEDLPEFHRLYLETAARDGFIGRGLPYFEQMVRVLSEEDPARITIYLARLDGHLLAATTLVRVGRHSWYSYGASADVGREVRPSNAIQWRMIRDALAAGDDVYDLRGISDSLDSQDPLVGLIRFKVGTGGRAQEYIGEWDFPLRPLLAKAFRFYLSRR